jgi:hypothetical protein
MTVFLIKATQTGDQIPGLIFSQPVQVTPTDFSVGMELNAAGAPIEACQGNADRERGWRRKQQMREL